MTGIIVNIPASIHDRLLRGARIRSEDFNLTLQRYTAERFLYRLGVSRHREQLVLKGAMLFALWNRSLYRSTRDLDFTGYTENDSRGLVEIMREICEVPCPEDGLTFQNDTITTEEIRNDTEYNGLRVKIKVLLGSARISLQIDVGFGDAIYPPARDEEYPVMLDLPVPRIRAYPREASIAEKVHAMVKLGTTNSRFKDFYDLYILSKYFSFDGQVLAEAIATTFERRRTPIRGIDFVAFSSAFYSDDGRQAGWKRYTTKNSLPDAQIEFQQVGELMQKFIEPLWKAVSGGMRMESTWSPGGPWLNGPGVR